MGHIARIIAWIVFGFVILAGAGFGILQTSAGKSWLAATLNRALAGPTSSIRVGAITGFVPFDFQVSRIELADTNGSWLAIDKAALAWSPSSLLRGVARVDRLTANEVRILRQPAPSQPSASSDRSLLSRLPVGIELGVFRIAHLAISNSFAGADNAEAVVEAHGRLTRELADVALKLTRTDGQPGAGTINAHYDHPANALDLKVDIDEPTGILMDAAMGRTDHLPLRVTLAGAGPLSGWKGQLRVASRPDIHMESGIEIAQTQGTRLALTGSAVFGPLLAENARQTFGDRIDFSVITVEEAAGGFTLEPSRIALASVVIDAEGSKSDTGALRGKAHIGIVDAAAASALVGASTQGALSVDAFLSGTADEPKLRLTEQGDFAVGTLSVQGLAVNTDVSTVKGSPAVDPRFAVSFDATAGSLRDSAADRIFGPLKLHVVGTTDSKGALVELTEATATGAGLEVKAAGSLADSNIKVSATIQSSDLALVGAAIGRPLGGSMSVDLAVTSGRGHTVGVKLSGTGDRLRTGMPVLDALLVGSVKLNGAGTRQRDGSYALSSLTLTTDRARLEGNGKLDPTSRALQGSIQADVSDLGALSKPLANPLAGSGSIVAQLQGTLDSPGVDATVRLDRVAFRSIRIDHADAKLSAPQGLNGPATLQGRIDAGKLAETLDAAVARERGNIWRIDKLRMGGSGGAVSASLTGDFDRNRLSGTLHATVGDLSNWSGLTGQPMAGRASLSLKLPVNGEGPFKATITGLAIGTGPDAISVANAAITGRISGDLNRPSGATDLTAGGIAAAGATVTSADIHAAAKPGSGDFRLDLHGRLNEKASLSLAGSFAMARGATTLRIASLDAKLGANALALTRPATASIAPGAYRLEGLALAVDGGTLQGDLALSAKVASADIRLTRMPLHPFAMLAGKHSVGGTLDGRIAVAGTPQRPDAHISLATSGLDLETDGPLPRPALGLTATADWRGTRADLKVRFSTGTGEALALSGSVPFAFDLASFAPKPSTDQSLALKIAGGGRLENLVAIVPLGEDRIGGAFAVDIAVTGTIAAPRPSGRISVSGGRYANMALGAQFEDIDLAVTGSPDRLVLDHLTATDGKSGTVKASGSVDLAANPVGVDLDLGLTDFLVARGDDMTIAADGALKLAGSMKDLKASGKIGVRRAELYIPDRLPANVVKLDVVEIGGPKTAEAPKAVPLAPIALGIALDAPGQIFVRGHGITSEWRGHVDIAGSSASPVLTGQLSVVNGSVNLLGQTFSIDKGVVRFDGGPKIDPTLNVQASAAASNITALVNVTGTANAPKIALSSTPVFPQDEILSRVLFGTNAGQLTTSQGIQLAAAAAQLAQGGPGVLDKVRTSIGLDRLDLGSASTGTTTNASQGAATGTTVTGGKYVANGVFVGVSQGFSGDSQARVEVEVVPNVSVTSTFGTISGSGLGAKYSFDY
jgi:translocation and assembly module TamB